MLLFFSSNNACQQQFRLWFPLQFLQNLGTTQSSCITFHKNMIFLFNGSSAQIVSDNILRSFALIISEVVTDFITSISSRIRSVGRELIPSCISYVFAPLNVCHSDLLAIFTPFVASKLLNDLFAKSSFLLSNGKRLP